MNCVIYSCENFGEIKKLSVNEYQYPFVSSQFCIVKKYETLYRDALPRFEKHGNTPYALPAKEKTMRIYKGIDREPLEYTPDDFHEYSPESALQFFGSISKQDAELLFIRVAGSEDKIPDGLTLLGYDAAWVFGHGICDGFSAICDCMFLCRWHGCDNEGTEFLSDFQEINYNGLFNSAEETDKYLIHYLSQDWAEQGEYCIYEIYGQL